MAFSNIFSGKTILVTGDTGFKGSWLSLWLYYLGAKVYGISNGIPTTPSHFCASSINTLIDHHEVDITDHSLTESFIRKLQPDFLFHLAAQPIVGLSYSDPVNTFMTNTMGTVNILDSLRSIRKLCACVFITSDKCYDNVEWSWGYRETDSLGGPDPYSSSKGAAELAIRSYTKSFFPRSSSIRIGIGRAGNVIGGGDWASGRIVPDCIRSWVVNKPVELRNPSSTRPWQHVLEPLSGYLELARALYTSDSLHGEPFNFGPSFINTHSVSDLVDQMSSHWCFSKPLVLDLSTSHDGPYESNLLKLNCDKALHHLRWHSVWNFLDTVKYTVDWYSDYYHSSTTHVESSYELSISQIQAYTKAASLLSLPWSL